MRIKSWRMANHQLSFVITTNSDFYPSCQLNGVDSHSKGDGNYKFPISSGTSYKLVCKSVFDVKVYKIQQVFFSPRNGISIRSVFMLLVISVIVVAVALNYDSIVVALK